MVKRLVRESILEAWRASLLHVFVCITRFFFVLLIRSLLICLYVSEISYHLMGNPIPFRIYQLLQSLGHCTAQTFHIQILIDILAD